MSRIPDGATRSPRTSPTKLPVVMMVVAGAAILAGSGCKELDGRNSNRHGNRLFRDMQFIDSAAAYEKALKTVNDPIIHYNLGLAYSKVYRPGSDRAVLLGESDDPVCTLIPNVKMVDSRVCIKKAELRTDEKENIRRFPECNDKEVCPSSFACKQTKMCSIDSPTVANMAADHFQIWIKAQPADEELQKQIKIVRAQKDEAEKKNNKSLVDELEKKLDELTLKDDIRKLTTVVWLDTEQYDKAIKYWEAELAAKPRDSAIMGNIAGIWLKAGNWRKSIEWYHQVVDISTDADSKVEKLQFIGNVAWSKLNSKTLGPDEAVELADKGIGALQKAADLQPKLSKLWGLQASLFGFRSLVHGASYAAAIDRATAEDLKRHARVLTEEAKKQQQGGAPPPTTPAPPASPSMSGGPAKTSGG